MYPEFGPTNQCSLEGHKNYERMTTQQSHSAESKAKGALEAIRKVEDGSESSIESREVAIQALNELGQPNTMVKRFLVYVPAQVPLTNEEKLRDPFAVCATCGRLFLEGNGDEYMSQCLKAKPDQATGISRIFARDPHLGFAVLDTVGGGYGWPTLRPLLALQLAWDIRFFLHLASRKVRVAGMISVPDQWRMVRSAGHMGMAG